MAKAGTAYITFRADFSELRRDLAKAIGEVEKFGGKEGEVQLKADSSDLQRELKQASAQLRGFDKRAKEADASVGDMGNTFDSTRSKLFDLNTSIGRTNRNFLFLRNTIRLIKFPALITALGGAAQGMSALAAGAGALSGALTPLSGLLAAYPALLGAIGQAAGVTALAGVKDLTEAMAGNEEALKRLTPEAKAFMKQLQALEPEFRKLQRVAQRNLFAGIDQGLRRAQRNFPALQQVIEATADAMGDLARRAGAFLGRRGFGRDFERIGKGNARLLETLGRAGLNFADALRHVMVEAQPLIRFLGRSVLEFSRFVEQEAKAGRESGRMAEFFRQTENIFKRLVSIGGSLAVVFKEIGQAGAPLGRDIVRALQEGANHLERWATSLEGRRTLKQYFEDARPALFEAGRLIRDITTGFFELGNTPGLRKLIRDFRTELLPVLIDVTEATTKAFGPALIDFAVQFGRLMGNFVGASGPLTLVVKGMTQFLKLLNSLVESSPIVKGMVINFVALATVLKALDFAKTISGFNRIRDAISSFAGTRLGQRIGEQLATAFAGARGRVQNAGARLRSVFLRAFTAVRAFAAAATEAVGTLIGSLVGRFRGRAGRFRGLGTIVGRNIGRGLVIGIIAGLTIYFDKDVEKWVNKHLPDPFNTSLRDIAKSIDWGKLFDGMVGALKDAADAVLDELKKMVADALGLISTMLDAFGKIPDEVPVLGGAADAASDAAASINKLRDSLEGVDKGTKNIRNVRRALGDLDDGSKKSRREMREWLSQLDKSTGKGRQITRREMRRIGKSLAGGTAEGGKASDKNMQGFVRAVANALDTTKKNVRKALKAFGGSLGKFKDYTVDKRSAGGGGWDEGGRVGSSTGYAVGGIVPGMGSGDTVPLHMAGQLVAMVEPGEYVSVANRTATAALMEANKRIKRRQQGGIVALGRQLRKQGYEVGENPAFGGVTQGVHVTNSLHYSGQAIDVNDDVPPFASGGGEPGSLDRLYQRLKGMPGVIELLWRVPNHYDHLHVAMSRGAEVGDFLGGVPRLPRPIIKGPEGPFLWHGQEGSDMAWRAANKFVGAAGPGATGGAGGWQGINSIREFIPYWNRTNPKWERYAQRFGQIVQAESTWNPRAINHIGLGHAGWYQYDPPTWRAYDQGAGNPAWPSGPFNPGLATVHTGTMLDHEGASTFSRWAATDPGAKHGGIVARLRNGGIVQRLKNGGGVSLTDLLKQNYVPIPKFPSQVDGASGWFLPRFLTQIRKGKKNALSQLEKRIGTIIYDEPSVYGLAPSQDKTITSTIRTKDEYAELAGIASTLTKEVEIPETATRFAGTQTILGTVNGHNEGYWLQAQLGALYRLRGLLIGATTWIEQQNVKLKGLLTYTKKIQRIRDKLLKDLQRWKKKLTNALTKQKELLRKAETKEAKARIQDKIDKIDKRIKFVDKNIKAETGVTTALNETILSAIEDESDQGTSAFDTIQGELINVEGLTGKGGEIFDTTLALQAFREMASALVQPGEAIEGDETVTDEGDSEMADLLRQLLEEEQKRNLVLEAQLPVFTEFFGGAFQSGGIVPGPAGAARLIEAHGGEVVLTPEQAAAIGQTRVVVVVEDGAVDPSKIHAEVDRQLSHTTSSARRLVGGRV